MRTLAVLLSLQILAAEVAAENDVVFAPLPSLGRPVRVVIYEGPGSQESGIRDVENGVKLLAGATIERLSAKAMRQRDLTEVDVVVFSAGSASSQAESIGDAGRAKVREFVKRGGGYLGICAGAYLACADFNWGLQLIAAETLSNKWRRGVATVDIELTPAGRAVFGQIDSPLHVAYENGPVMGPIKRDGFPPYRPLATFTTEVAENDTPPGIMTGSPAMAEARYGAGHIIIFSPHPERTPGLERVVPLAVARLTACKDEN